LGGVKDGVSKGGGFKDGVSKGGGFKDGVSKGGGFKDGVSKGGGFKDGVSTKITSALAKDDPNSRKTIIKKIKVWDSLH
jgi:hypothetical protein